MAKTKISDVNMSAADNGVIISWNEKTEKSGNKGTFDNCCYEYLKKVIQQEDGETTDAMLDRSIAEYGKLWKQQYSSHYSK